MDNAIKAYWWLINPEEYAQGDAPGVYFSDNGAMQQQGWYLIQEVEVPRPQELPSREAVRGEAIEMLREKIEEVDAKAYAAKNELQKRINDLLMIGHDTSVEG